MRIALGIIGTLAVVIGLIWIGQGLGYFRYPPGGFMIDNTVWAYRGAALMIAGLVVIIAFVKPFRPKGR